MIRALFNLVRSFISDRFLLICLVCTLPMAASHLAAQSNAEIFANGSAALQRGDYAVAEQDFAQVLRTEPKNVGALSNLGVVYARSNRPAKAIAAYRQALAESPDDAALLLNLGLAYLKQEDYRNALPQFQRVQAIDPANRHAQELAATCRIYTGALVQAIADLEMLRQAEPNEPGLLYLLAVAYARAKQPAKAKSVVAELLKTMDPVPANFLLGKAYYAGGQFASAEASFLDVLAKQPDFPQARLALAKVYISERESTKALNLLHEILQKQPSDADANYFAGALLVQDGNFRDAVPYLETARKSLPDSWAIYFYLGKAALRMEHVAQAIPLLQHSAQLNPDEEPVYYLLAQALNAGGRSGEAQQALERVRILKATAIRKEEKSLGQIPDAR